MGYLTSGKKADPALIKRVIAEVFSGATDQGDVDRRSKTFVSKLKDMGIRVIPLQPGKERVVFDKKLGVVVDGYHFRFQGA